MLMLSREVGAPSTMQELKNSVVSRRRSGSSGVGSHSRRVPLTLFAASSGDHTGCPMVRRAAMTMDFLMMYFLATMGCAKAIMRLFYFADQGVLATAPSYADDEPKLMKFMRDMGYPKTGEWCGEFAASII